jgi:hypothetical protein
LIRPRSAEIVLAVAILASLALVVLKQRAIETLLGIELEGAQAGQRLVEIAPLVLQLPDALGDSLKPAPVLGGPRRVGFVQAQVFADGVDRKSETPQSLNSARRARS